MIPDKKFPIASIANLLLIVLTLSTLLGLLKASFALAAGLMWGWFFAGSHQLPLSSWGSLLLKAAIILLGLTLPIQEIIITAQNSFFLTLGMISFTLSLGLLASRILKIDHQQAWLISSGTAICGGSAIAAVGTSIKASHTNMVTSLAIIFILNALALFIFPSVGHLFEMTQEQFGLWAALAIHDTSSVVGAAVDYGSQALDTATTAKLARALWIVPVALLAAMLGNTNKYKLSIPLFIIFFIISSMLSSFIDHELASNYIKPMAKNIFALSLLWIGSSLNQAAIKSIPLRSFMLGMGLWFIISIVSLFIIIQWY